MKSIPNIKSYAIKLLGIRNRSELELRTKLQDKGYGNELIAGTIGQIKAAGLIDDQKTAEFILRYCKEGKMLGENGSRYYLKKRGIPDEIIDRMVFSSADEQIEMAIKLIGKKERALKNLPIKVKINRLYGQLQRKGYDYGIIRRAITEYEGLCEPEELAEMEKAGKR
ncbi:MAG: regulatory protein RecX [Nitrospirae bacterium]|nr:regulatory protein RecX [Nitrospirota bacterium]